ncbi:amidohydrolase family protein [Cryobacterium sp. GrIS_2_6]|uniref:amidohydrolase family protein n=1 Tax=Cryobacterium sp. GrIS_2_6 TaxID=3162785 RepID=UPI002DF8C2E7|nr:amidohydrolase family protein [Cryobacterium psychrotolerans]MEC5151932.1 imidazolonepropionase-like amidohydrolase [Cryobacterium psychrotolerans]
MTTTTITTVRVFDGAAMLEGSFDVTFTEQGIRAVTATTEEPIGSDTIIDGTGKTLLPGLIDTHVHFDSYADLGEFTRWGLTTVLDMGTHPKSLVDRMRDQTGLSDVRSSGSPASGPGSNQTTKGSFALSTVVSGPDDAPRFVADRVAEESDYIKIIIEDPARVGDVALGGDTIAAIVQAAHTVGLQAIAHASSTAAFHLGIDAGVDILTHVPLNGPITSEMAASMAVGNIRAIPTLIMMKGTASAVGLPDSGDGPGYHNASASVTAMAAAGLMIAVGTDANNAPFVPFRPALGESMHDELQLLVDAGLSPTEALRSATSTAAALFGLDDRGSVREGSRADLLLVTGDPTADITATRNIDHVWTAGIPAS